MNKRTLASVILVALGLLAMLAALIDPLEGAVVALVGSGLVAGGALLDRSRYRGLLVAAFVAIAVGLVVLVVLTAIGGLGGHSGRSLGWGLLALPYPVGWLLGVIGAILKLVESWRSCHRQACAC